MPMTSTSYSRARRNLKSVFDQVCRDHEPVVITRRSGENVVVLSEEDYASLEETAYLLRSPANARRLLEAVARDRAGEPGRSLADALAELDLVDQEADENRAG
jgi:antitoxin YefM